MLSGPLLLLWWTSVVLALTLALEKDRHPLGWLAASLLGGPLAVAALLALRPTGRSAAIRVEREAMELCDACLEPVRRDRARCRYCDSARPAR